LRGWQGLGLAFDEAMTGLDLAILLAPTEREMPEASAAVRASRDAFVRLGADPLVARIDAAGAGPDGRATKSTSKASKATGDLPVRG